MFILKRKYEFHAARKLTKLDKNHPCTNLHGHTFSIKVKVSGSNLDKHGWLMDFYDIDSVFNKNIHSKLDHKYLNDIDGLSNPTTENLSMWIWNKLKNDLVGLESVTVSEGNSYGCTYYGEKNG